MSASAMTPCALGRRARGSGPAHVHDPRVQRSLATPARSVKAASRRAAVYQRRTHQRSGVQTQAATTFPSFLPAEVEDIEDARARNLAARLERVPVDTSIGLGAEAVTLGVCVAPPTSRAGLAKVGASPSKPARPQVFCLHGFDSSCLEYRRLVPLLEEKGFDPWAIDILGWGFTEMPKEVSYTPEAKRKVLYDFWRQYVGTPIVLVGGSIGGAFAIDFAREHPDAVDKLVLVDPQVFASLPPPPEKPPAMPAVLGYVGAAVLKSLPLRYVATWQVFKNKSEANPDAIRIGRLHCLQEGWSAALVSYMQCGGPILLQKAVMDKMAELKQETLILWGEDDAILEKSNLETAQASIDDFSVEFIPDCGHQPHVEQPEAVVSAMVKFMNL